MIAKKLLSEKSLAEKMVVGQFHPESSWLYELVFDEPIADHSSLLRWCEPGLVAVSLEEWKYQLQHSGQILKLAFRVNRSVAPRELDLGPNYFEALKQYASALTGSDSFPTIFPSNAASLLGGIESPVRLSFRDHLLAAMDTNQKEFFDQFGEELAMHLIFSGRGGEILTHFASNQSTFQGLVWLNQTLSQHTQEFLEKYSSLPELQVLKESIERKLSETNTNREIFTPLVGIAQILQIEVLPGGNLAVEVVKSGRSQLEMVDHYGVRGTLMSLAPNESASKIQPALSPDGTNLAYVTSDPTFKEVRVVNLSDNRRIDLFRDESLTTSRPSWSPDNGTLAYVKDSSICSVAIQTGDQKTHTLGANDDRPSWSPDGEQIAFHRSSGDKTAIFVVTAKGNAPVRLSQNGSKDMEPSWSPDGTRLLFVRHTDGQDPAVYEMDSSGGTYEKYLFSDPDPHSPIWMIDKKIILFQSGSGADGVIYRYNLETRVKKKITSGVNFSWVPQPILE